MPFGSYVENTNVKDSDIDLLMLVENRHEVREIIGRYTNKLSKNSPNRRECK